MAAMTQQRERAAYLVAESELTYAEMAKEVDVAPSTIHEWKKDREFQEAVEGHRHAIRQSIRSFGIAIRENRIKALNDRWKRLKRVIQCRAEDPEMMDVPGGDTGLMVHKLKMLGDTATSEYSVDTGMLAEMRQIESAAAGELGQLEEKHRHEHVGPGGGAIKVKYDLSKLTKDDWIAIREVRNRAKVSAGAQSEN